MGAYNMGDHSLVIYNSCATDFGYNNARIGLGAYTLGGYSLRLYSSPVTAFGSRNYALTFEATI